MTRKWTADRGLIEHESPLASFAELLDSCLDAGGQLPERITLVGTDRDGRERAVHFSFASSRRGKRD